VIVLVARRRQRLEPKRARLERALHDRHAEARADLAVTRDVVGIGVRRQQVRHRQALARDDLEERLERRTAVHEDGGPARLVGDEVGVREPAGVHAPLDQHRR
jgi:acyl transferase domain-containing protein